MTGMIKIPGKGDKSKNGGKIKIPAESRESKKGTNSVGMNDETAAKLEALSKRKGKSKTAIIRYLVDHAE